MYPLLVLFWIWIAFVLLLPIPFLSFVNRAARVARRLQDGILARHQELRDTMRCFRVRYASHDRFRTFWKIFPFEASGILWVGDGRVIFHTCFAAWQDLSLSFNGASCQVVWIGKKPWPNGGFSWFSITANGEHHYFTADTGAFIFGSKPKTREIFAAIDEMSGRANHIQSKR